MRPIVTDRVAWFVCLSVTLVSPEKKTGKPIEMLFGLRTRVGSGNHVLDGSPDPPWEEKIFEGERAAHCKVQGHSGVICAKPAKPIEMQIRLLTRMDPTNHELDDGPDPPWEGAELFPTIFSDH